MEKIDINALSLAKSLLEGKKLEDVAVIDLSAKPNVAYKYMIIATVFSARHGRNAAEALVSEMKKFGLLKLSISGLDVGDWIMVDFGSVAAHLLKGSLRAYYDLDGMWINEEGCSVVL